jgi:hypothetical protein
MYHKSYDGEWWVDWEYIGGNFISAPTAVRGLYDYDVFGIGTDDAIYRWKGGRNWERHG